MLAGGICTTVVFVLNEALDAHYFVSEAFAGLTASVLAMWAVSRRSAASEAEREVYRFCWRLET
jgi:hypothetical protein